MSKRILVVEDQPDNRQIICDMLAPTNYEITEAENGEEALAAIANQRPDLILMDFQLPVMDGYEATRRIKADAALRSIPIIAVTSYALSGEGQKARVPAAMITFRNPSAHVNYWRKLGNTWGLERTWCGRRGARLLTDLPVWAVAVSPLRSNRTRRHPV
jgi:two-component system, cell cycle response regulator DivK